MKCDVIIPVGPGHEEIHKAAIESVRIASMDKGQFVSVNILVIDDTKGELGRSKARNQGILKSQADWLFFLDADDLMHPKAFHALTEYPYIDALFGNIWETANGVGVWRYQVPKLSSYDELLTFDPYHTLQMGHFVKTCVAKELLFDETMDCGEDFHYYLRLWKDYKCMKVEECLFLNRKGSHSSGPKSATGREWTEVVNGLINQARIQMNPFIEKDGYVFPATDTHFTKNTFELYHIPYCLEEVPEKHIAVDVGAHVGAWTKELAKSFSMVFAFEAKDINYQCLEKNTKGMLNVTAENLAVGDVDGNVSIATGEDPGNSGQGYVKEGNDVGLVRLDDVIMAADFIKIDVEGYEPKVIQGAKRLIKECEPVILIEQTPGTDRRYGESYLKAGQMLEEMGYKLKKQLNKNYLYAKH